MFGCTPQDSWQQLQREAAALAEHSQPLAAFVQENVLQAPDLVTAVVRLVAARLQSYAMPPQALAQLLHDTALTNKNLAELFLADLQATFERDPACQRLLEPLLFFKGFHALAGHRLAHCLWQAGQRNLALYLQACCAQTFAVDIHPAAQLGRGLMLDHATGIVIGETAVVGDNVSMLHSVTLGGTGKEKGGKRHPTIGSGVLLGAGAKVLGPVRVGDNVKVAAGSIVLADVPAHVTVVGAPAKVLCATEGSPALTMDQQLS